MGEHGLSFMVGEFKWGGREAGVGLEMRIFILGV